MMGEPLDVFSETILVERLDGVDDPRVKLASTVLQESAVGDFVRERVLERVLDLREQPSLIQELGRLEPSGALA
jgi:hypothetical protein